ncbi:nucleoside 2-deoxyribosyltransferase [Alkalihalobacillus trypoxylicola]|uniref:Group-specific protein n=1 Tax=Alkalihalobacillus trypoxylicola TaxID=519424 RepID=A0A162CX34_9BACI|nr:nucleoside 2-deoxyribosyltransferase [Alkalihalobacillus trypoxylicola]KYG26989.1 group-specific protein [Alkalihalobacillus trypoxylicola]
MNFYIASSFQNKDTVRYVSEKLKKEGHIHTYDWTQNERALTIEKLKEIGQNEKDGVGQSDIVVVILPGGKGTHIELGIAIGQGKRVYLYSPTDDIYNFETTSTFYHLQGVEIVIGSIDDLIEKLISI